MSDRSRCFLFILLASLVTLLPLATGCTPAVPKDLGTTTKLDLPDSEPPVLSKAVADRIHVGMSQEEVLSLLQGAALAMPSAKSSMEAIILQGKLNSIRYDLTVAQGKRKLFLAFKDNKLVDKSQEGLQ